ncbi:MAG: phenylacetate-CoA oxygenase subunit PaaI [Bacteroidetes bacterium]|nr:MAG: phenylacetate-CoA oxygenase subunit PaaI [Bacteroidota bacterium]
MTKKDALFQYCLRLGDDAVVLGHRLAELCSRGPFLEEDLALTNIALDLTGQAQLFFLYAAELDNKGQSADDLVYRRPERQFYNHLLCEQPNTDFGYTIVRQFLFSAYHCFLLEDLCTSQDEHLADISKKALKESRYHLSHATDWMVRLGQGTKESKQRAQQALDALWMYTGELFEMDDIDLQLLEANVAADLHTIRNMWQQEIAQTLKRAGLQQPEDNFMQTGSRKGVHTEHLGHLLAEMQSLVRAYPEAAW